MQSPIIINTFSLSFLAGIVNLIPQALAAAIHGNFSHVYTDGEPLAKLTDRALLHAVDIGDVLQS